MPKWDERAGLIGFDRIRNQVRETLAKDDVVYLYLPGMMETRPRPAPAEAAAAAAGVLYNVNEFCSGFFKRGAIKATLLTVDGNPPREERERLKAWWQRFFSGVNKAWNAEVVSAAVTPVVVGEGIQELANSTLTEEKRGDIATAIGVPHSIVMSNAANYATAEADRLNFYDTTIVPHGRLIERQLNAQMFAPLGYRFAWHPERMTIYQADEHQRSAAFAAYVNSGMRQSVAAQILGITLPEGMDYAELDADAEAERQAAEAALQARIAAMGSGQERTATGGGGNPGQADSVSTPSAKAAELRKLRKWAKGKKAPDVSKFQSDILSDDEKRAALAGDHDHNYEGAQHSEKAHPFFELPASFTPDSLRATKAMVLRLDPGNDDAEFAIREALERRTAKELRTALNDMLDTLFPEGYGEWQDPNLEAARIHRQFLADQKLKDALSRALLDGVDLGVSVSVTQLENVGFGFDWTLAHIQARDWAAQHTDEILRQLADVTQTGTGQAIARWINNGEPLSALVNDLEPFFGAARAERIAVTETTRAFAEGSTQGYIESGVVAKVEWLTSFDEIVCPTCAPMQGMVTPLGDRFRGGLYPPAHVNCRCGIAPVVKEG